MIHFLPKFKYVSRRIAAVASLIAVAAIVVPAVRAQEMGYVSRIAWTDTITVSPVAKDNTPRNFYMAVKSNMLYDALAVPNLGAEFYIGKNWSIAGNWMYAWWSKRSANRFWRIYGGDIAVRRWLGKAADEKPLTGHHLGIYAGVVTYDFEWGGTGYMGGLPHGTLWDRCQMVAGIEYGYSLPVSRRINIDFTIGLGYRGGKYIKYRPENGAYVWESSHHVNWWGPTKAEISLVWLIGNGNYNAGKGGRK